MGFSTVALLWLNVGEAALLVYSMPLWVALLAWALRGERPTLRTLAALALGFVTADAVIIAKMCTAHALEHGYRAGRGAGPVHALPGFARQGQLRVPGPKPHLPFPSLRGVR